MVELKCIYAWGICRGMRCILQAQCVVQVAEHSEAAQREWSAVARLHSMAAHEVRQFHHIEHAPGPPTSPLGASTAADLDAAVTHILGISIGSSARLT